MAVAIPTTPGTLNVTGAVIGIGMVALLGFVLWALIFKTVPDANQNVLLVVIGALTTNVTAICAFFYGASLGSRQKDTTIAVQADTQNKAQSALAPIPGASPTIPVAPGDKVVVEGEGKGDGQP